MSEVVGSILLVGVTVTLAAGFAAGMYALPGPTSHGLAKLNVDVLPGLGGWGTGDERVEITHAGGQALTPSETRIHVDVAGTSNDFSGQALTGPFADGTFKIGERWTLQRLITGSDALEVDVVRADHTGSELLAHAALPSRTGLDCTRDILAPSVTTWAAAPADVNGLSTGDVALQVVLTDDCSGLDDALPPHLQHRFNLGTNPPFVDDGALTHASGDAWSGTIPEPNGATHWTTVAGQVLEYRIVGLKDHRGNVGNSSVKSDPISLVSVDTNPNTPAWASRGIVSNWGNVIAADGSEARLQEAGVTATAATERYGTTTSTSGSATPVPTSPDNARYGPNSTYVSLANTGQRILVGGFASATNPITNVEVAFRGHYTGTRVDDTYQLRYRISGSTQACKSAQNCYRTPTAADSSVYMGVFADRAWTWSDIRNLDVRAEYIQNNSKDNGLSILVDALWIRVTTSDTTYAMSVQANFTNVPFGLQHEIQLKFRTTPGESFKVQVYQPGSSVWIDRDAVLTSTSSVTWTYALTAAEYAGGSPRIRFVDLAPTGTVQGEVDLDYLRVHTT